MDDVDFEVGTDDLVHIYKTSIDDNELVGANDINENILKQTDKSKSESHLEESGTSDSEPDSDDSCLEIISVKKVEAKIIGQTIEIGDDVEGDTPAESYRINDNELHIPKVKEEDHDEDSDVDMNNGLREILLQDSKVENVQHKVPGELLLEDIDEDTDDIVLNEDTSIMPIGKIVGIVEKMIVIKGDTSSPALDADSAVFLNKETYIGKIFDTFGPVKTPFYSIHQSSKVDTEKLKIGTTVFFAPFSQDLSNYVFLQQLEKLKGSDASWKDDIEPTEQFVEYSDDEQERHAKKELKAKRQIERKSRIASRSESVTSDAENEIDDAAFEAPPLPLPITHTDKRAVIAEYQKTDIDARSDQPPETIMVLPKDKFGRDLTIRSTYRQVGNIQQTTDQHASAISSPNNQNPHYQDSPPLPPLPIQSPPGMLNGSSIPFPPPMPMPPVIRSFSPASVGSPETWSSVDQQQHLNGNHYSTRREWHASTHTPTGWSPLQNYSPQVNNEQPVQSPLVQVHAISPQHQQALGNALHYSPSPGHSPNLSEFPVPSPPPPPPPPPQSQKMCSVFDRFGQPIRPDDPRRRHLEQQMHRGQDVHNPQFIPPPQLQQEQQRFAPPVISQPDHSFQPRPLVGPAVQDPRRNHTLQQNRQPFNK